MADLDPLAEELFLRALEQEVDARDLFLAQATAGRPGLRREVEVLLAADASAGSFIDRSPLEGVVAAPGYVLDAGARVDDFELTRELGRGGMGVVWEALELGLGRRVAIKLLHSSSLPDNENRARFQREAAAAGRLNHSGVVRVFAVGSFDGRPYIVQELVEGGRTLADLIDERRRAPELPEEHFSEVAELMLAVARSLVVAHGAGVIHRDVKPANVLLAPDGSPKLADFGLARIEGAHTLYSTRALVGTPFYMSPEQVAGRSVDARSDVFSTCAVLFEALSLRRPFQGDRVHEVLRAISADEVTDPRKLLGRVPRDLAVIAMRGLEKEPARRFESAQELVDELERYVNHEPILSRPAGPLLRARKWMRRHPALATGILASTVFLSLLLWASYETWNARKIADAAKDDLTGALEARTEALNRSESRRLLALSAGLREEDPGLALLLAIEGAGPSTDFGARVALLAALDRCRETRGFIGHEGPVTDLALDARGERLVTASADGTARVWDVASGAQTALFDGHEGSVRAIVIGQDGSWVASADEAGTIIVWDPDTALALERLEGLSEPVSDLVHDHRSGTIAAIDDGGAFLVRRRGARGQLERIAAASSHTGSAPSLAFIREGEALLVCSPGYDLWAFSVGKSPGRLDPPVDARGQQILQRGVLGFLLCGVGGTVEVWGGEPAEKQGSLQLGAEALGALAIDERLGLFATAPRVDPIRNSGGARVGLWTFEGDSLGELRGHDGPVTCLAFRSGRRELVTGSADGTARLWSVPAAAGHGRFDLAGPKIIQAAPTEAGDQVASIVEGARGRQVRLMDLAEGSARWAVPAPAGARDLAVDPRGRFVACVTLDGLVMLDADSGRVLGRYGGPSLATVSMDAEGRRLAAVVNGQAQVQLFDLDARQWTGTLETGRHPLSWAELSPDGQRLLTVATGSSTVGLWRLADGERLQAYPYKPVLQDSRSTLGLRTAAFDADGSRVAIADADGTIRLWETDTARLLAVLEGGSSGSLVVAFDRMGERLLSGALDGSVTLWDLVAERPLSRLEGRGAATSDAYFLAETGRALSFCAWSGRARVWPLDPLPSARAARPREILPAEAVRHGVVLGEGAGESR